MENKFQFLKTEVIESQTYVIRLCRPDRYNALNNQLRQELIDCCKLVSNNSEIRVVILTGQNNFFLCRRGS